MKKSTAFVFAMIVLALTQTSFAQLFGSGKDKPNSEFVPRTAVLGAAAFPKKLSANPDFKVFPHEVVTAWGKKELGFDPMLITEITFVLKRMDKFPPETQPGWAAVLQFEKMQGLAGAMIDKLEEKKVGGKTVYSGGEEMPSFMVFDESTLIVGNETWFEELITAGGKGKLVEMFSDPAVQGQVMTFADIKEMRPMFTQMLTEFDKYELPTQVANLREIPNLVDSLESGLDVDGKIELKLIMHAANNDAAERVSKILVEAMTYAKVAMLTQMATEMDLEDPVQAATIQYARRVAEKFETKFTPEINGSSLTVTLHEEILALPFMLGMVGSNQSMQFKQKMTPELQLRVTTLAALNYESAYRKLPSTTINDENGKPLFSGLVSILPFMDQYVLHDKLRLDEPWDSEHNSQFTSMKIEAFGLTADGNATVRLPIFPGSVWENGGGKTYGEVTDGTSNTIFAIQAPDDSTVSWADPAPWNISETNPMRDVFGNRDEVLVAMMDGSSRLLKRNEMTNEKLKALLTIAGGELID